VHESRALPRAHRTRPSGCCIRCGAPARRAKGEFKRISWDEALDEIAARFKALAAEDPETILPAQLRRHDGHGQYASMDRRFFHRLGASLLDRTLCSSAGKAGIKATLGGSVGMDPERFDEAKLIILWGANPIVSNLHLWSRVQEAKRRGAKIIAIDPYLSLSAEKCTQHIAPLPGTDGALALGVMHVLIAEGLIDPRLHRSPTPSASMSSPSACGSTRRSGPRAPADWRSRDRAACARIRNREARRRSPQLRHAAPRGRRESPRAISRACPRSPVPGATRRGGIVLTTSDFYSFNHAGLGACGPARRAAPAR
jgi:anaerobic selenocysteine-containing dehydrogenase